MHVITIVGARPQFIKAAALSPALEAVGIREDLLHTGQHYDERMSAVFFDELGLQRPRWNLDVRSASHAVQTARMLEGIEGVLVSCRPDAVIVYGDTNSTLAGTLAATKLGIPVAHVEAGLRSFDRSMPEEQNRVVADHLATWRLAPTEAAVRHLRDEGVTDGVHLSGDIMIDGVRHFGAAADRQSVDVPIGSALATVHRAATTDDDDTLRAVVDGLCALAAGRTVVIPLHPRTRTALRRIDALETLTAAARVCDPFGYLDMIAALSACEVVVTDSGGLQKEAWALNRPAVVLRTSTEWTELVDDGWVQLLAPSDARTLPDVVDRHLAADRVRRPLYGDGQATRRVAQVLARALGDEATQ